MVKIPSLSVGKNIVSGGSGDDDSVQPVTWTDNLDPSTQDWLGLFLPGASNSDYLGAPKLTGTAAPSGSTNVVIPAVTLGVYELRLFSNKTTQRIATSPGFFVSPLDRAVIGSITLDAGDIRAGGVMHFTWYRRVILGDPVSDACIVTIRERFTALVLAQKVLHGNGGIDSIAIPSELGTTAGKQLELVLFEGATLTSTANPTNLLLARSGAAVMDLALPVVTLTASADPIVATTEGVRLDVGFLCSKPTPLDQIIMWRFSSDIGDQPVGVVDRLGTAGYSKGSMYPAIDAYRYGDGYYCAKYRSMLLGSAYDVAETVPFRVTH